MFSKYWRVAYEKSLKGNIWSLYHFLNSRGNFSYKMISELSDITEKPSQAGGFFLYAVSDNSLIILGKAPFHFF
jgi:hypothetical protein